LGGLASKLARSRGLPPTHVRTLFYVGCDDSPARHIADVVPRKPREAAAR
jgi:hypothetical protein